MSKQCPNCGNLLQDQTRYCDRCGAPQAPPSPILPPQPSKVPKPKNVLFRILLIFMLVFLIEAVGLSGLVLFAKFREKRSAVTQTNKQINEQTQILIDQATVKEAAAKAINIPTERQPLEIQREKTTSTVKKTESQNNSNAKKKEQTTDSNTTKKDQQTQSDTTKKDQQKANPDTTKKDEEEPSGQTAQGDIPQQSNAPSGNPTFEEFAFYENDIAINGVPSSAVINGAGTANGSWKYCLLFNFNMKNEAVIKEVGLADLTLTDQTATLVLHPQQLLMDGEITPETDEGVGYQPFSGNWTNEAMDLTGNGVSVNLFSFYSDGGYDYVLGTTLKTETGMFGVIVLMRP